MEIGTLSKHVDSHLILSRFAHCLDQHSRTELLMKTKDFKQIKTLAQNEKMVQRCNEAGNKYAQALDKKKKSCQ